MINIDKYFPFDSYRPKQKEVIEFAVKNIQDNKKFIILECPTGSGKSPIGIAIASMFPNAFYITSTKVLQDQLGNDFGINGQNGHHVDILKGRNAYRCNWFRDNAERLHQSKKISNVIKNKWLTEWRGCDEGRCLTHDDVRCENCLYRIAKNRCLHSKIAVMNYYNFIYQTSYTGNFDNRKTLIIDEAHNLENVLLDMVSINIIDSNLPTDLPELDNIYEYAIWIVESNIIDYYHELIDDAVEKEDFKLVRELKNLIENINLFLTSLEQDEEQWVFDYELKNGYNKLEIKPVHIDKFANKLIFSRADHIILMSATILNVNTICKSLGINKQDAAAKRIHSTFPIKRRPIVYIPSVKVTGGQAKIDVWGEELTNSVSMVLDKHEEHRGIIHTHNFYIAEMLMMSLPIHHRNRLIFQKNYRSKDEMLKHHTAIPGSVIIAPAMHEGIDLKDDLSRFQIICKMPFPNFFQDKQLKLRKEEDENYYIWLVALKLVQSTGRSVRHNKDWAITYIIDKSFGWWHQRNKFMLPKWFNESIIKKDSNFLINER